MKIYEWSENLSIRIDRIDDEHKQVFDKINELSRALSRQESNKILGRILEDFVTIISKHFSTEEVLFEKYNYPDATVHKSEHDKFNKKMGALMTIYNDGRYALSVDTIHFLKDWVTVHIKSYDMAYASYIKKADHVPA